MTAAARISLSSLPNGTVLQGGSYLPAAGATAFVYTHLTTTQVTVFAGETGGGTLTQPVVADSNGKLPGWIVDKQDVDIVATYNGITARAEQMEPIIASQFVVATAVAAKGTFAVTAASQLFVNANLARRSLQLYNLDSSAIVYGSLGGNPAVVGSGFVIEPLGSKWSTPDDTGGGVYTGIIYLIGTGTATVAYVEL